MKRGRWLLLILLGAIALTLALSRQRVDTRVALLFCLKEGIEAESFAKEAYRVH